MTLKKTLTGLLLLGGLLTCGAAQADTYTCDPTAGVTSSTANLGDKAITNPDLDVSGTIINNIATWNTGAAGKVLCDCATNYNAPFYYTTVVSLPPTENIDGKQFYKVNEYIDVAANIYMASVKKYYYMPWEHRSNEGPSTTQCGKVVNISAGSQGKIDLRITKKFVGSSFFNNTHLFDMYASKSPDAPLTSPFLAIYLNGSVTVPQNCVINAGTQLTVDLGKIYSGDLATAGQKPEGYTPKSFNVPIQCNNMDASANLTLREQGTPASGNAQALQSDNTDVGVVITDNSGNVLTPNDSTSVVPFQTDDSNNASVTLQTYPVNTSGNTPAEGLFTTLAYLRIDFA